jgi:hypothetical protein
MEMNEILIVVYFLLNIVNTYIVLHNYFEVVNISPMPYFKELTWAEIIVNVIFIFGFLFAVIFVLFIYSLAGVYILFENIKSSDGFLFKKPFKK